MSDTIFMACFFDRRLNVDSSQMAWPLSIPGRQIRIVHSLSQGILSSRKARFFDRVLTTRWRQSALRLRFYQTVRIHDCFSDSHSYSFLDRADVSALSFDTFIVWFEL